MNDRKQIWVIGKRMLSVCNLLPLALNIAYIYASFRKARNKLINSCHRGVSGGWAIAHPVFGRIDGADGLRRCAALLKYGFHKKSFMKSTLYLPTQF
jgi:hypothetical protein